MTEPLVSIVIPSNARHTDVLVNSGKTLTVYEESYDEPGTIRGTCFCGAKLAIINTNPMALIADMRWTIFHDELALASTSTFLLWNKPQIRSTDDSGFDLIYQVCRSHDEWAGLL